jgi:hypothetical protein
MKINLFKSIVIFAFITLFSGVILLTQPYTAYSANVLEFTPQIPIPGMGNSSAVGKEVNGVMQSDLLARYIKAVYDYGLAAAGVLAAIVLMGAGLIWLTSGGNESKITQAKDLIAGSITGLIILFGAWMLLNTVNPELLKLRAISLTRLTADQDYLISSLKNAPTDLKYGWICMTGDYQRCEDNNPPSINLDNNICRTGGASINAEPSNAECPYNRKKCCGQSNSVTQMADNFCQNKSDYTPCSINTTAVVKGYCYQKKCINTKLCCQCGQGGVGGVYLYVTCRNDVTLSECSSWCINGWVGSAWLGYVGGSESYSCAGGAMSYCRTK